jgi:hypothetical protein
MAPQILRTSLGHAYRIRDHTTGKELKNCPVFSYSTYTTTGTFVAQLCRWLAASVR